jgi:serine/threonine protein kinase
MSSTNYTKRKLLGKGAMGEVYASHNPTTGEPVAIKNVRKTISMDKDMTARLTNEADLLERVVHHNVVRAITRGEDADGSPYLVMSYVEGQTLWQLIERDGSLAVERSFAIVSQILTGLAAIHEARVVHADIKSNNVLIDDQDRVTIIDFGLARTLSREIPRENMLAGTPAFMAPETISGAAPSVAADIYAVGVILYEMLTGMTPFAHSSDIFDAHLHEPVVVPSLRNPDAKITMEIDRLVLRALSKEASDRFATARDFAAALDAARSKEWRSTTVMMAPRGVATEDLGIRPTQEWARGSATDHKAAAGFDAQKTTKLPTFSVTVNEPAAPAVSDTNASNAPTTSARVRDIISLSLDRAGTLVETHDLYGAIAELETGLAQLMRLGNNITLDHEAWRLEQVLAALYDSLGRRAHARRMASLAYAHARQTGNESAIERTKGLVERLDGRSSQVGPQQSLVGPKSGPRLARGSTRAPVLKR